MADIKSHSTLTTGLVSYWDLEEASGTRYDLVGSNNGTDTNTVTQSTGQVGNCASFNAANSEVLLLPQDTAAFEPTTTPFAVSLWFKTSSTSNQIFFANYQYSPNQGWSIGMTGADGAVYLDTRNANISYKTTHQTTGLNDGSWHHIVAQRNNSTNKLEVFVDNVKSTTETTPVTIQYAATTYPAIGASKYNSTTIFQYFTGDIDEVGFWSKALSTDEISDLYNSGNGLPYYDPADVKNDTTLSTSLVSYWEMEDNVTDSHGSNDLTTSGSPVYATGIQGNGIDLERDSSQRAEIADATQTGLEETNDFSWSMWVKPETLSLSYPLHKGATDNPTPYRIETNSTTVGWYMTHAGGTYNISSSGVIGTGAWYHIVGTKSSTAGTALYVNGVLVASSSGDTAAVETNTSPVVIGARRAYQDYFDGVVDEVAYYGKVLSVAEVRALYGYGTPPVYDAGGGGGATFTPIVTSFM